MSEQHAALVRCIARRLALAEFDVVRVIDFILSRVEAGRQEHGDLNIATDRRDFKNEEQQEHADLVVYRAIDEIRRLDAERADLRAAADREFEEAITTMKRQGVARTFDTSDVGEGDC